MFLTLEVITQFGSHLIRQLNVNHFFLPQASKPFPQHLPSQLPLAGSPHTLRRCRPSNNRIVAIPDHQDFAPIDQDPASNQPKPI